MCFDNCFIRSLVLFSNSPETIRTKGMKGQLSVRLATSGLSFLAKRREFHSFWLLIVAGDNVGCFCFATEILRFITSHLHTVEK